MKRGLTMAAGAGLGAGLMYLLDPDRGNRRRALLRDKVTHTLHRAADTADEAQRDLRNRMQGWMAETRSRFTSQNVPDHQLAERVRARLGRVVSHPGSIEVMANQGRIALSGPILESEVKGLLKAVSSVRGVKGIDNQLEPHAEPGNVPGLQGTGSRPTRSGSPMQSEWSPARRFAAGTAGGALAVYATRHKDPVGVVAGAAALGLVARAFTPASTSRLTGIGAGHRAVDIEKTLIINAPVERVYEFWANFENFPLFMHNVQEVSVEDGRSHWRVTGPASVPLEWNAVVTEMEPNRTLAWKTEEGAVVPNAGIIHFEPAEGGTRVHVKLSYNPPGGAAAHKLVELLGEDPKAKMDEDLLRMKSLLETGVTTR